METVKAFVIPYSHADWAWTFTRRWHEKRYLLVFSEALEACRKNDSFRWYFDCYLTGFESVLRLKPDLLPEIKRRVESGQVAVCGAYTNLRPALAGEESQIRNLILGRKTYRSLFPKADLSVYADIVDVSVGHPQMPQLLHLAGYRRLRFGRPHAALSKKKIPLEFIWRGIDGTTILSSRGCYSGFNYYDDIDKAFFDEVTDESNLSPTGIRWLSMGTDDARPLRTAYTDREIPAEDFMRSWNEKNTFPVRFATPVEYFEELNRSKKMLPVIEGTLDPCEVSYNIGFGGNQGLLTTRYGNDRDLVQAEYLATLASFSGFQYPSSSFTALWKEHLAVMCHATQWLLKDDFTPMKNQAEAVGLAARSISQQSLQHLAHRAKTPADAEWLIANTLPFERRENIQLTIGFPTRPRGVSLVQDGKTIPCQIVNKTEQIVDDENTLVWEYQICAEITLPPGGAAVVSACPQESSSLDRPEIFSAQMESHLVAAVHAPHASYSAPKGSGFGEIRYYRVDTAGGKMHVGPITEVLAPRWNQTRLVEDGCLYQRIRSEGTLDDQEVVREVLVHKHEPRLEIMVEIFRTKMDGFVTLEWPHAATATLYGDMPFGVEEKNLEAESFGLMEEVPPHRNNLERQRENCFYAKTFVQSSDNFDQGMSYVNNDSTHFYLKLEDDGPSRLANILHSGWSQPREGWEKNLNQSLTGEGRHRFVSHLVFHQGNWKTAETPRLAERLCRPPIISALDAAGAGDGIPQFSLEPSNLILTSFYRERKAVIMRFYESAGVQSHARIEWPITPRECVKLDLAGKILARYDANSDIPVRPYEIVTLRMPLAR